MQSFQQKELRLVIDDSELYTGVFVVQQTVF